MILTSWLEQVRNEDVLNIRSEFGEVYFSIRRPSGTIVSWRYSEIMRAIENDLRTYQGRYNIAQYDFIQSDINTEGEKMDKLLDESSVCSQMIRKLEYLDFFFHQKAERFKAGVDWKEDVTVPVASSEPEIEATALKWGVKRYIELKIPRSAKAVKKNRPVARETIEKFFPKLSGKKREKKIDSMREKILTRTRHQLEAKPKED